MNAVEIANITQSLHGFLAKNKYSQIAIIVDQFTYKYCYPIIKNLVPKHLIIKTLAGEKNKNLDTCTLIWQKLTEASFDRHGLVINLGGGVIGDMGGFCAATYKRGIDFIQIPTTLLSQVDASVGGKLGIDFNGFKNHIGVFCLPKLVLIDPQFLSTLPIAELRSGFAEVIKHCLIRDKTMWTLISKKELMEQNWEQLISHSVAIKTLVTETDPTEKGLRKILNFGHTLGHAIETCFLDGPKHALHGEAIAVGMIAEAFIAKELGLLSKADLIDIEEFIFSIYGKVQIEKSEINTIVKLTYQDKKNLGKDVRFSILNGIGNCEFDVIVSEKLMKKALLYYMG